jgi:hypothetical protein
MFTTSITFGIFQLNHSIIPYDVHLEEHNKSHPRSLQDKPSHNKFRLKGRWKVPPAGALSLAPVSGFQLLMLIRRYFHPSLSYLVLGSEGSSRFAE